MFIILSASQAANVRGPSASVPSAALEPIACEGGVFILGVDVIDDPAHATHRDYLAALPKMNSVTPEFPPLLGASDP